MKKYANAKKVKRSGLRAIDQGGRYDITGRMRSLAREIERGALGEVGDVVIAWSVRNNEGISISARHWGNGSVADAHWIVTTAKNRLEPA